MNSVEGTCCTTLGIDIDESGDADYVTRVIENDSEIVRATGMLGTAIDAIEDSRK